MIDLGSLSRGQKLGMLAALSVIVIGAYFVFVFPGASRVRMLPTLAGGGLALAGALHARPTPLVLGFIIGFLPFMMGPYMLLVGWHATWVGICELLYLVAAAMMVREQRHAASGLAGE